MKFLIPKQTIAQLFLDRIINTKNRILPTQFERFEDIVAYVDDSEELSDDICGKMDSGHSDNSKSSKENRKAAQSKGPQIDTMVNRTIATTTKISDNSKNSNETRKATQSKEPKSNAMVESEFNQTTKGVTTRS